MSDTEKILSYFSSRIKGIIVPKTTIGGGKVVESYCVGSDGNHMRWVWIDGEHIVYFSGLPERETVTLPLSQPDALERMLELLKWED